jgi:isopenicillin-N epimerase
MSLEIAENPFWGPDWPQVRALWSLDPSVAHLNHGSFGAVPIPVQRAQDELRQRVEANPMNSLSRTLSKELDSARAVAAKFLDADLDGFAFVRNATTGANTVLAGPFIREGDEVLVTDQTYGAVKFAAERICSARGARLLTCDAPLPQHGSDELVDAVLSKTTSRTRMAIVDHIASPTGLVFPVKRIIRELQKKGILVLVDAAHAPGMINVSMKELNPDFWTGNFHKWCCAPRGSAGLWVKEEHRKDIKPIISSWYLNEGYPSSFRWLGTDDYTPYLSVPAALEFMERLGWNRVRTHNKILVLYGRDVVNEALGTEPVMPGQDAMFEAMTLVRLPPGICKTDEEARVLQARLGNLLGMEACPVAWNGRGYLRLSAQAYNSPLEYDKLAGAVSDMLSVDSHR